MNLLGWLKPKKNETVQPPSDPTNHNYVCIPDDPIHSMNDLREGDWNMDKVQQSFAMGLLRYATESEVAQARAIGRIQ